MRRVARSVALVVGLTGLVAFALSCGERPPTPPPGLDQTQLAGWQAYVDLNCASCHGEARQGKRSGPALNGLSEHWTADQLVAYFADPDAMVKVNPRLAYKAEQYAIAMPAISAKAPGYAGKATPEALAALAEYMLVDIE